MLAAEMLDFLRPLVSINTFRGEDASAVEENPVFYQFAMLVCRLVLVPQWGMGVEVTAD